MDNTFEGEVALVTGVARESVARPHSPLRSGARAWSFGSRLKVDLLVPSPDETYPTIPVPELSGYAQGLPYLKYVLSNSQEAPILSPHGVVMVRVPVPERYAIHKLMVSQLRGTASSKAAKDLRQAATLLEAVVERFPGAIEDA
jgi:hypothetical protein